jgi:hypothetical protein
MAFISGLFTLIKLLSSAARENIVLAGDPPELICARTKRVGINAKSIRRRIEK